MLLCLHSRRRLIAHGYAKASGRMMGAILHSNVGLLKRQHGHLTVMDRYHAQPRATGPWDSAKRRPWIAGSTPVDQGALVRGYTKWDNQPDPFRRRTTPSCGPRRWPRRPVRSDYVNLDAALQEAKLGDLPPLPDPSRFRAPRRRSPRGGDRPGRALCRAAASPVIMIGRSQRTMESWRARSRSRELGARVVTDLKWAPAFRAASALRRTAGTLPLRGSDARGARG